VGLLNILFHRVREMLRMQYQKREVAIIEEAAMTGEVIKR
jgi:hypothetical protein